MSEKDAASLGAYLRAARERAGLSLRQTAALAGIDYGYLSRIESGEKKKPSADILQALADALSIDSADLFAFFGVKPAATLPSVRTYFRRKLGVDADEAEVLAQLIEDYQAKKKGGMNDNPNHRTDDEVH